MIADDQDRRSVSENGKGTSSEEISVQGDLALNRIDSREKAESAGKTGAKNTEHTSVRSVRSEGWKSEVYDTSSAIDGWGNSVAENHQYIYYTTKNAIVRIDKTRGEKVVMKKWKDPDSDRSVSLCCSVDELFYLLNGGEIFSLQEKGKSTLICSYEMLEEAGHIVPEIFGITVYRGKLYALLSGLDVVSCSRGEDLKETLARDVRLSAFFNGRFYYIQRPSDQLHQVDLDTMQDTVVRKRKYKKYAQYQDVFSDEGALYYTYLGDTYLYREDGKDKEVD